MKADPEVIKALNACLEYERTLADCCGGYHAYFTRWRIHRLEKWFAWQRDEAARRVCELELRINALDTIPGNDRYPFDVEEVKAAADIDKVFEYFDKMLEEARDTYEQAAATCKEAGDSVSAHLCGHHKGAIEEFLIRIEAKRNKVKLVGPVEYLAHHLHQEG